MIKLWYVRNRSRISSGETGGISVRNDIEKEVKSTTFIVLVFEDLFIPFFVFFITFRLVQNNPLPKEYQHIAYLPF